MRNFIGRKQELADMENLYQQTGFQMLVVYGRRRVGKSTLLQEFVKNKKVIFYTAIRSSSNRNMELLGQRVIEALAPEMQGASFKSYEQLFEFLGQKAKNERIVFIIDEFPYWAEQDNALLSILQKHIDQDWLQGQMYFILSGSSISFMEDEVLSEKSPLFGRRTAQLHVKPFSYLEAAEFIPAYTPEEKAISFGVTGGIAKYLSLFDENISLDDNIKRLFFNKTGYLYEEPTNLLMQEFRNISIYNDIIGATASGRTKLATIADLAHMEQSKTSHAVSKLISTGILNKEYAITDEKNKKKIRYSLADNMFRFWYRFVAPNIDIIEIGHGDKFYEQVVKPQLSDFMGDVFESICRYYLLSKGGVDGLPGFITRVGKWWGTNPRKKEETDIDVVGLDTISKTAVIGECKFKNEVVDKSVFEALRDRQDLLSHEYRISGYMLFSKSGFSDWIIENAEKEAIYPINLSQMYG